MKSSASSSAGTIGRWASNPTVALGTIVLAVAVWTALALGLERPLGLVVVGITGAIGALVAAIRWPLHATLCVPVLVMFAAVGKVFPYEIVLVATAGILALSLALQRSSWLTRLDPLEVAVGLFLLWAIFTVFWCRDTWWWLYHVRRMVIAAIALWVALRVSRLMRGDFALFGLELAAAGIAITTLIKAYQVGWFSSSTTHLLRRTATDVGWGTSNYIAAILTLLLPVVIQLSLGGRSKLMRAVGWSTIALTILVITIAASRGGAIMVLMVTLFAIFGARISRSWATVMALASVALLLFGPGATQLIERFSNPKDLGSIVVRWEYWKVAWQRIVDHWPIGMGHGQGWEYPDRISTMDPHNYWLTLVGELGLLGLILWIAILVIMWRRIGEMLRDPATRLDGRMLQLVFILAQVNQLFEPTFPGLQYCFFFFWVAGVYFGRWDRHVAQRRSAVWSPQPAT